VSRSTKARKGRGENCTIWSLIICIFHQIVIGDQTKDDMDDRHAADKKNSNQISGLKYLKESNYLIYMNLKHGVNFH
jgi:hypothetical protein